MQQETTSLDWQLENKKRAVLQAHARYKIRKSIERFAPRAIQRRLEKKRNKERKPFMLLKEDGAPFKVNDDPLRFQFYLGNPVVEVPIEKVLYSGGIRHNANEHPFIRYLVDGLPALERFYENFQPGDVCEQHFLPTAKSGRAVLPAEPWTEISEGVTVRRVPGEHGLAGEHGAKWYGPVSPEKIQLEADKLTRLKTSFEAKGLDYDGKYLQGYLLVDNDGCWGVRANDGQHRLAVMAHMGYETAIIRLKPAPLRVVHERDVGRFPMVRLWQLTRDEARAILRSYTQPFSKPDMFAPLEQQQRD